MRLAARKKGGIAITARKGAARIRVEGEVVGAHESTCRRQQRAGVFVGNFGKAKMARAVVGLLE